MNLSRILIVGMFLLGSTIPSLLPSEAKAATNLSRAQIRQMPITARPSRPGHFYGNAVRRQHYRRNG